MHQVREAFQLDKFVTLLSYDPKACGIIFTLRLCHTDELSSLGGKTR